MLFIFIANLKYFDIWITNQIHLFFQPSLVAYILYIKDPKEGTLNQNGKNFTLPHVKLYKINKILSNIKAHTFYKILEFYFNSIKFIIEIKF